MNVWGDPTHRLKRQLNHCTHFRTTMQQSHTAWNTIPYLRRQNVTFIEPDMWPPSSLDLNPVNYTIWAVLHFLLYGVYICQKSLNFTYAFKCYQQNCSWLHFTWPTLYIGQRGILGRLESLDLRLNYFYWKSKCFRSPGRAVGPMCVCVTVSVNKPNFWTKYPLT